VKRRASGAAGGFFLAAAAVSGRCRAEGDQCGEQREGASSHSGELLESESIAEEMPQRPLGRGPDYRIPAPATNCFKRRIVSADVIS
jgi:hypothetical protein